MTLPHPAIVTAYRDHTYVINTILPGRDFIVVDMAAADAAQLAADLLSLEQPWLSRMERAQLAAYIVWRWRGVDGFNGTVAGMVMGGRREAA